MNAIVPTKPKSPFFIVEKFISPMLCEEIVDNVPFVEPDIDVHGNPMVSTCTDGKYQDIIFEHLTPYIQNLQEYYNYKHKGTEYFEFELITENSNIPVHSENAEYLNNHWVQTKQRDLTGVIFLSDYNEQVDFDSDFECYGGKLEFLNHKFGFNPNRGTMIIFPSEPRFCNATSTVLAGELYQVRFHIAATTPFIYNPKLFPGDYRTWF